MSEKELRLGYSGSEKRVKAKLPPDAPSPWDLGSDLRTLGKPHTRIDGVAKVTGKAKFSYDIRFPGMIFAKMLRSPHASAMVKRVDLSRAKALKGVLFTEAYEGSTVRFAGQQVAAVAAESEEILDDALALIEVEYEVRPHVVTVEAARKEGAPQVKNGPNVNRGRGGRSGDPGQVAKVHQEADAVIEREYRTQVQTHSCLETHGCVCKWDEDHLTVWSTTQGTFSVRASMALSLGIPPNKVTVITEHMGGGFGSKFGADVWDVFCAKAARATGRACRYLLDRKEEHLVAGNRPSSIQQCRFSVKKDGTLMGAEVRSFGTGGVGGGAGVYNPGIYSFQATLTDHQDVFTHAGRARAFRAPRHPQGIFALEGMVDELAEAIGMDPLELRRKNDPHPVRKAQYEIGAKEIGWERRKKSGSGKGTLRRGIGMASARWPHTGRPGTVVHCRVGRDGSVLIANGAQDLGTGTRTVFAITAAEELGLEPTQVEVRLGNTNDPVGPASGGSTTTPSITPPTRHAAWEAKREILKGVSKSLGGDPEQMDIKDGRVVGAPRPLTFKQACGLLPPDGLETTGRGRVEDFGLPGFAPDVAGVQFAEVEVDTETGSVRVIKVVAVQDCGTVVNPLTTRSQIDGGVIQGISYALYEERHLDERTGDMVNTSFLDYKILGALEMPEIVAIPFSVAQGKSTTSISSLGEPPTTATAGAVANAIANAIGTRVRSLPITPDKVLAAMGGA